MSTVNPSPTIYESSLIDFSVNGCLWQIDNFFTDEGLNLLSQSIEKETITPFPPIPEHPDKLYPSDVSKKARIHLTQMDEYFDISEEVLSLYHAYRPLSVFGKHKMPYPSGFDIKVDSKLIMTYPRTKYHTHSDADWKFMSMIIYLGESGDGTRFLPREDGNWETESIEIPWKNNCGYFFFTTEQSYHFYWNKSYTDIRSVCVINVSPLE